MHMPFPLFDGPSAGPRGPGPEVPVVSLIVAGTGDPAALRATLASMLGIIRPPHEVIVVDTGLGPACSAVIRDFVRLDPSVRPHNAEGLTVTTALNAGAMLARGAVLAFVVPGTRVPAAIPSTRWDLLERRADTVAAVVGRDPDAEPFEPLTPAVLVEELSTIHGAPLAMTRTAWDVVGGFDESQPETMIEDWILRALVATPGSVYRLGRAPLPFLEPDASARLALPSMGAWDRLWHRVAALDPVASARQHKARARHRRALAVAKRHAGAPRSLALGMLAQAVLEWPAMLTTEPRATWDAARALLRRSGP